MMKMQKQFFEVIFMKRFMMILAALLALVTCLAACTPATGDPIETTDSAQDTTEAPTEKPTEEPTTEEPTTEEPTTPEETTEPEPEMVVDLEAVKAAAITFITPEQIKAAAENPENDWSDFGGVTDNADGSVKVLYTTGKDDKWDPYCYLVKDYVMAGNIAVIQYRSEYDFDVNLYIGSKGNVATGPSEYVHAEIYQTEPGKWNYLVINLEEDAMAYDHMEGVLGFLRFGLDFSEPGDTVDFGFVAFFYSVKEAAQVLPLDPNADY